MVRANEYRVFDLASCEPGRQRARCRRPPPGKRRQNLVADVHGVGRVLHAREHREERRIEARRHVDQELIDLLLRHDQLLVEIRRLAEGQRARSSRSPPSPCRSRRTPARETRRSPTAACRSSTGRARTAGPSGGGSVRNRRGRRRPGLPAAPVLLDQRQHLIRRHVAGDDDRRVLRRYQRSKNIFEYAYSFGMFSMSRMNPIVVCL